MANVTTVCVTKVYVTMVYISIVYVTMVCAMFILLGVLSVCYNLLVDFNISITHSRVTITCG